MRIAYSAAIAALLIAVVASAQDGPTRVRGTVESVHGSMLTVKSRDGGSLEIKLAENVAVVAMVKASLADIRPGSFVGATAMPQDDGRWKAVEVHIFPERMRGIGEGDRPNDYRPSSTMTNGTVDNVAVGSGRATVTKEEGATLTLAYKEGEKKIDVVPQTVIYTYAPGDKDELKPGSIVSLAANRQPDGALVAAHINVARGIVPPM